MLTPRDFEAFDRYGRQAEAIGEHFAAVSATPSVLEGYRRHTDAIGKRYTDAIGKQLAAVDTKAITEKFGMVNALSPVLQNYRQTAAIAMQIAAVAAPVWAVPEGPSRSEVAPPVPSVNWLLLGQCTLRVLFAAIVIAVIYAAWEEQKENAPAITLLEIFGALWLWNEIDEAIWKRLS